MNDGYAEKSETVFIYTYPKELHIPKKTVVKYIRKSLKRLYINKWLKLHMKQ